jgi:N-acetylmuramoyl-L-alanine amidase
MIKVIVDPGHGGQDSGASTSGGDMEKEVTLALAKKLVNVLQETGTIRPVLTRQDDYMLSLDDRAGMANHRGGDLLISLHLGSSFHPSPLGISLYCWSPATSETVFSPPSGQGQPWDQEQLPYWERSRSLATLIQQELVKSLPWPTGTVTRADLYLLRRVRMPAVLVELGSMNHLGETEDLKNPTFQDGVVRALGEAIIKYRDMEEKEVSQSESGPQ